MSNKATTPAEESKLSSFVSHLFELRDRLLKMVIAIGIFFIILAPFAKFIYGIFAKPLADTLPDGVTMLITGVAAPLLVPYKLVLMAAFLIALPYVFYQAWHFVAPGLYKHEKRLVFPLLASSVLLFYCGIAFAYFVLLPMMFTVIPMFTPDVATYSPDIGSYLDFVMMMFIAFGFSFEMPIATILLISTGTTTAEKLAEKRPYVIVGAFVVGMILTPPDVISQILLAVPMWLLFELGLFLSKFFNQRVAEASTARKDRAQAEADEADRMAEEAGDDNVDSSPKTTTAASAAIGTPYSQQADESDEDAYRRAEEAEANDDSVDLSPQATAAALAAKTSVADQANALWNDEDENGLADVPERKIHNEGEKIDTNPYQAFENYEPKTEEELDAELDEIEKQELAEEQTEFEILNATNDSDEDLETLSELKPEEMEDLETELAKLEDNGAPEDVSKDYTDRLDNEKADDKKS